MTGSAFRGRAATSLLLASALVVLATAAPAYAEITPSRDAVAIAQALGDQLTSEVLVGGEFTVIPPLPSDDHSSGPSGADPNPTAIANAQLTGFPLSGPTFAVLSSGNSTFADDQNTAGNTGQDNNGDDGGHGATFHDVVTLRVDLSVPQNANCVSVDFRFLSDEFPEYVGHRYNDAFVAELDESNFSADEDQTNKIIAPRNFAVDRQGNVISVNATGAAGMSVVEATGTTYDGATPRLRAATPVTPGMHQVFFSIFDQGDDDFDSAVFLDNLVVFDAPPDACKAGATPDVTPPDTNITAGPDEGSTTNDKTPTFAFTSTEGGSTFECRVDGGAFAPCSSPHTTAGLADGQHTFRVRATDPGGNPDSTPATRTFTVSTAPPPPPPPPPPSPPPPPPPPPPPAGPKCDGVAATIVGTAGKDTIRGTNGRDVIVALGGNDKINGRGGNDLICAGDGNDKVDGGAGNDRVRGGAGKDTVHGESGNDRLSGGPQRDRCRGGSGQNILLSCEW